MGSLSNLQRLELYSNQLSGAIPSQLGSLSNLQRLELHSNQLRGTIPGELGSLSNLQRLELHSNQLTGTIPSQLGSLSNLTELWLNGNQLSGAIPGELGSLSSLLVLHLDANQLSGAIPGELGSLSKLRRLYLSENPLLTGCIPAGLRTLHANDLDDVGLPYCDVQLSSLSISPGTLTPTFDADVTGYTVAVANTVDQVTVTATVNDATATVAYLDESDTEIADGDGNAAGHQVSLDEGANTIKVKVTAEDNSTTEEYTVTVTRGASNDATLIGLALTEGTTTTTVTLTPSFASATTSYTASVANAVATVTVTPTKNVATATVEYLDASDATIADADTGASGQQVALSEGANTIKVKVTLEDNSTTQTYTVTVRRRATAAAEPTNFAAAVGNAQVVLSWDAPASDSGVTRHEYQFKTGTVAYGGWERIANSGVGGTNEAGFTVPNLTNEVLHTFQLRAVNAQGASTAADADPVTPTPGICDRTPQVRDAIMAAVGAADCNGVTAKDLAGITALSLESEGITALKSGDFAGLSALELLHLHDNPGAPFALTVGLERTDGALDAAGPATLKVTVREGAPARLAVPVRVTRGTPAAPQVTVPAGALESSTFTVTQSGEAQAEVTLGTLPSPPPSFLGISYAAAGDLPLTLFSPNAAPTAADKTVTTNEDAAYAFAASDFGFSDTDTGDALASVTIVKLPSAGTLAVSGTDVTADQSVAASDFGGNLTFTPAANASGTGYARFTFKVSDGTDESAAAYTMTIDVTAVNDAPTAGTVTIDDTTPTVGDTLTASVSRLADPDGLPDSLVVSWQWYRTPGGGSETMISGASASGYTVADADAGVTLTAKATYTDSDGFSNTIASAATSAVAVAANAAPSFTSPSSFSPDENQTAVGRVLATDSDAADSVTGYALAGGAERSLFSIGGSTGALTFNSAPDFEDPQDAGTDGEYLVTVRATSGEGARADRGMYKYYGPGRHMAFRHQLGTKPIGKRLLLLPEPRPGPSAEPKIICHPEAGNTKYIPLSGGPGRRRRSSGSR